MKQFTKKSGGLMVLLMVLALVLTVGACKTGTDGIPDWETGPEVDWISYTRADDRAFWVRNETSKQLIAFKGSLHTNNILGGIPNSSDAHGIKKNNAILQGSADFPMILITREDYDTFKNNLDYLEQRPFTRIYVCYNSQGSNESEYRISGKLGGNRVLEIVNGSTSLNAEIRLGGINGGTIGYAPAGINLTQLFLTDGDYDFFPVFKRYNQQRDVVETLYPKASAGPWYFSTGLDEETSTYRLDLTAAINALTGANRTSGVAYLTINNSTTSGAVQLLIGGVVQRSATGLASINAGVPKSFPIDMLDTAGTFSASRMIANLTIGQTTRQVPIKSVEDESTSLTFLTDRAYVVNVTGDGNAGTLAATVEMRLNVPGAPTEVLLDW